jgi:hypothetical protein
MTSQNLRQKLQTGSMWTILCSVSEVFQENGGTENQLVLDKINSWALANDMRL